jgi:hypothetical protein
VQAVGAVRTGGGRQVTSPFLTFAEVAAYLRYDLEGPHGEKAADALRKWLAKYGCRPSLRRGLYRLVQIEAAIDRLELAQSRRRHRGFQSQASRFDQRHSTRKGAGVSSEAVGDVHADDGAKADSGTLVNSIEVTR